MTSCAEPPVLVMLPWKLNAEAAIASNGSANSRAGDLSERNTAKISNSSGDAAHFHGVVNCSSNRAALAFLAGSVSREIMRCKVDTARSSPMAAIWNAISSRFS